MPSITSGSFVACDAALRAVFPVVVVRPMLLGIMVGVTREGQLHSDVLVFDGFHAFSARRWTSSLRSDTLQTQSLVRQWMHVHVSRGAFV